MERVFPNLRGLNSNVTSEPDLISLSNSSVLSTYTLPEVISFLKSSIPTGKSSADNVIAGLRVCLSCGRAFSRLSKLNVYVMFFIMPWVVHCNLSLRNWDELYQRNHNGKSQFRAVLAADSLNRFYAHAPLRIRRTNASTMFWQNPFSASFG